VVSILDRIGVGIIGCGEISKLHIRGYINLVKKAKIVAISDIIEERVRSFSEEFSVDKWYTDYEQLLKVEDIDTVDICAPHNLHTEIVIKALEAGKHVICEKPIALTLEEADQMIRAAERAHKKLMIAHNLRFMAQFQKTKEIINKGTLGKLGLITINVRSGSAYESKNWRLSKKVSGGGALMAEGIHFLDLLRWYVGEADQVLGITEKVLDKEREVEDNAVILLRFKDGTHAYYVQSSTMKRPYPEWKIEICGSKGSLVTDLKGELMIYSEELKQNFNGWFTNQHIGDQYADSFRNEIEQFIDCIKEDRTPPVTGEEGKASLRLLLSVYKSAETNEWVKLSTL